MANQYLGKVLSFELSPEIDGKAVLVLLVTIPKLRIDIELGDEGTIPFLESKYPFINQSHTFIYPPSNTISCVIQKEADSFKYESCLTLSK